jgi:uncharacterized protein (TIRG00374 family)
VKPSSKSFLTALRVFLGIGLLYYVLSATGGWLAAHRFLSIPWLLPGLATLTLLGAAIESKRLGLLLESQGISLPFWRGYQVVAIGAFFNFCIPGGTGGDVMKLYYLALDNRRQVVEVATVLLVDRAIGLFSLLLLVVGLAIFNAQLVREYALIKLLIALAVSGSVGLALLGIFSCSTAFRATWLYRVVVTRIPLHRFVRRVANALSTFRVHKGALIGAVLLSMLGHVLLTSMFVAVGSIFIPNAASLLIGLLSLLALLANALPITPGGLGVGEAASEGLFALVGFAAGAQLILAWRLGMFPLYLVGSMLYIVGNRWRIASGDVSVTPRLSRL